MGHLNIQTTRGYVAVFEEDLVRHYQEFLDHRRVLRLLAATGNAVALCPNYGTDANAAASQATPTPRAEPSGE